MPTPHCRAATKRATAHGSYSTNGINRSRMRAGRLALHGRSRLYDLEFSMPRRALCSPATRCGSLSVQESGMAVART